MQLFKALNGIEEALIESHSIDILLNRIELNLVYPDNGEKMNVVFRKVSAFYFVNGYDDSRYATSDYEHGEKRELLSIVYGNSRNQSLLIKAKDRFYNGFDATFNFTTKFDRRRNKEYLAYKHKFLQAILKIVGYSDETYIISPELYKEYGQVPFKLPVSDRGEVYLEDGTKVD